MKTFLYSVIATCLLLVTFNYLSKSNEEQEEKQTKSINAENRLLTNARIDKKISLELSEIEQKITGELNFRIEVSDTINGALIKRTIAVPKACYDTVKIGQRINYLTFSQIAEPQAKDEAPDDKFRRIGFVVFLVFAAIFLVGLVWKVVNGHGIFLG